MNNTYLNKWKLKIDRTNKGLKKLFEQKVDECFGCEKNDVLRHGSGDWNMKIVRARFLQVKWEFN